MKKHHAALCTLAALAAVVAILLVSDVASAQELFSGVVAKVNGIESTFRKILRTLFLIAAGILGYLWVKGNHEARDRTERYLIGLAIAFGATEIVGAFES